MKTINLLYSLPFALFVLLPTPCWASAVALAPPAVPALATSPAMAYLKNVHLDKDLANYLLGESIGLEEEAWIRASIRVGADIELLHRSARRLCSWLCLRLDEEYYPLTGKQCCYSVEDWVALFNHRGELYVNNSDATLIAQHLIKKGVDINAPSSKGLALALAIKSGFSQMINVALAAGANPDLLGEQERIKMDEILTRRYDQSPSPKPSLEGEAQARTSLGDALKLMDATKLEEAMALVSALPNRQKILDDELLFQAMVMAHDEAPLIYLIEHGANVNAKGAWQQGDDRTVLSHAASQSSPNPAMVESLVNKGARFLEDEWHPRRGEKASPSDDPTGGINDYTLHHKTPLMIHLENELWHGTHHYAPCRATEFYLSLGANPSLEDREGRTALFYACTDDKVRNLKALIKAKVDVNHKDAAGRTALFTAIEEGAVMATFALLEAGAQPYVIDDFGKSTYDSQANKRYEGRAEREKKTPLALEMLKAYQGAKDEAKD